ncbi:MAG: hypothetical protein ACI8QD_002669 [Cyclobacteriaceae bacterium]|jgi:hypothetical protein
MKKIALSLAIALSAGSIYALPDHSEASPAKEKKNISIEYIKGDKVNIKYLTDSKGKLDLTIMRKSDKKMIATQIVNFSKSFALPVDLKGEDQGSYLFTLSTDEMTYTQEVFISHMDSEDVIADLDEVEAGIFQLKILHQDSPVTVTIADANGRVYHNYTHISDSNFLQKIDRTKYAKNKKLFLTVEGEKSYQVIEL